MSSIECDSVSISTADAFISWFYCFAKALQFKQVHCIETIIFSGDYVMASHCRSLYSFLGDFTSDSL